MFQASGIYLSFYKMSELLILLDEINSHIKYVYSSRIEELTFPSRIHRKSIAHSDVYFNEYGQIW